MPRGAAMFAALPQLKLSEQLAFAIIGVLIVGILSAWVSGAAHSVRRWAWALGAVGTGVFVCATFGITSGQSCDYVFVGGLVGAILGAFARPRSKPIEKRKAALVVACCAIFGPIAGIAIHMLRFFQDDNLWEPFGLRLAFYSGLIASAEGLILAATISVLAAITSSPTNRHRSPSGDPV
jgi:hypothetical protein